MLRSMLMNLVAYAGMLKDISLLGSWADSVTLVGTYACVGGGAGECGL